jgi:hypothetical protein
MTYLDDGRLVARAVFLHQFSEYYGMRSFFYSLVILPFHWNVTAWPVVALQCLLVSYVLRLVVRSFAPGMAGIHFLILVLLLSLFTSAGWYSCLILPDILGPLLYLSMCLLAFAGESLSRSEKISLVAIACWGVASHATHLMLAGGLCVLFAGMMAVERKPLRRILNVVGQAVAICAVAAVAQLALHGYLYGKPSLNGERPPFLMARVISDGPGRWYLEQHCPQLNWAICAHVHNLSTDPDQFLWAPDGTWEASSASDQSQMMSEEMPLVFATLRTYPRQQLASSLSNFREQLWLFGLYDLDPSSWALDQFDTVMPAARAEYLRGRQARNALPLEFFTAVQYCVVVASLGVIVVFLFLLGRKLPARLIELGSVVAFVVVANALFTGPLSLPEDRFECRVIWLIPFFAGLMVLAWIALRGTAHNDVGGNRVPE